MYPNFSVAVFLLASLANVPFLLAEDAEDNRLATARQHFQRGRYAEAIETLDQLAETPPTVLDSVQLTRLRCHALQAQGERLAAEEVLIIALQDHDDSALLHEELAKRRAVWKAPAPALDSGYWKLYIDHVTQADEGADLDFLRGKRGSFVPKDNH